MSEKFELKGDYIELVKLLKITGLCQTGGEAKNVITDGLVKVDGEVEIRKKKKIRTGQKIDYNGSLVEVV